MKLLFAFLLSLLSVSAHAAGTLGYVNVQDHGVVGNGTTDDWPALQNILDNVAAERATIYFPAGHYYITQTIQCGGRAFNFRGDGRPMPYNTWYGGSFIRGNFAGPLIRSVYPAGMLTIEDMAFANWHASGQGLLLGGSNVDVSRVGVSAFRAIEFEALTFTATMRQIIVRWNGQTPGSVGIAIRGHTTLHGADIVGFNVGLRLAGAGNDVRSLRVEVNRTGIELGANPDGSTWALTASSLDSVALEANDYGIVTRHVTSCAIRNVIIQGTVNSPSGGSKAGLVINHSQWTAYEQIITSNTFSEGAIRVMPGQPTTVPLRFVLCKAGNLHPTAPKWDFTPSEMLVMEQCS